MFMYDSANTRLGIGTSTPASTLDVHGNAAFAGNVGIGTSTPQRMLHLLGSGPRILIEDSSGGNSEVNFKTQGDTTANVWALYKKASTGDLRFYQGADKVTIQNGTGNVGIGTTIPNKKLHVVGDGLFNANMPGSSVLSVSNQASDSYTCGLYATIEGVVAVTGQTAAIQGVANTGNGLYGGSTSGLGVVGSSGTAPGTYGSSTSSCGVLGTSGTVMFPVGETLFPNVGVAGVSYSGVGVEGDGAIGVLGQADTSTSIPIVAKASATQTANLQEWRNGSDKPLAVVDANGQLGVGTNVPLFKIHVAGIVDPTSLTFDSYGVVASNIIGRRAEGTLGAPSAVHTDDALLVLNGRGYGSTGFSSASRAAIRLLAAENWSDAAQGAYIRFETTPTGSTSRAERMRITGSGNVGIGTASPAYMLDVAGSVHATSFPTSSDMRFKEDVTPIDNALDKILSLTGIYFKWNHLHREVLKRDNTKDRQVGLIAQQVREVLPEVVSEWADQGSDEYLAVDYNRLVAVLIQAVKEQQEEFRNENEKLRERIAILERTVKQLAAS
jgi:hypothetical protein